MPRKPFQTSPGSETMNRSDPDPDAPPPTTEDPTMNSPNPNSPDDFTARLLLRIAIAAEETEKHAKATAKATERTAGFAFLIALPIIIALVLSIVYFAGSLLLLYIRN